MKTRIAITFFLFIQSVSSLLAQVSQQTVNNAGHPGNTYAVIVGISKYESDGITQLDFAHKDAQVFADYLKSKAGGVVPEENIRLLLNENATYGAIYDALNWLLETTRKDDLVYFYFSGHGDMENNTIYKLGFLLSYNTPRVNYINNAVRIEDLNYIANTLSLTNHAKVVLITDACHSGKLAGSEFRGNFLVGEQLRTVQRNEIRITSCAPDQLSMEDEGWDGGRGVFSYYLIKGLEGLADYGHDGTVTVNEIKNYLDTSLSSDPLLAERAHKQSPVIKGIENFRLASVDDATLATLKKRQLLPTSSPKPLLKALPVQPQTYFFDLIKKDNIEELADFNKLNELLVEEIPFAFLKMVVDSLQQGVAGFVDSSEPAAIDSDKIALLEKTLRENKDAVKRFNEKLVVMLSDRGQTIINLYLDGDAAELERRRYYNSYANGYDVYPKMFSLALKLIPPEHSLHKILEIKLHYFAGVAARLKTPTVKNAKPLLDLAMSEQRKALALEENAAYIQIEMGVLYDYQDDYATAEKYYLRATQIAPQWSIPWSNLVGLYANTKKYDKALEASRKAIELQKDFQGTYINTAVVYQRTGNLLLAEELFRKSIKMNSRHFLPFEGLGHVYLNTTEYALADSFFYEADLRKQGFHNPRLMKFPKPLLPVVEPLDFNLCFFDSTDVGKNDVLGHFAWAMDAYQSGKYPVAEREFKKVTELDNENPLAFHYLGKLLYEQKRWKEADIIFNYALSSYLDDSAFRNYYDSLASRLPHTKSRDCILSHFKEKYYQRTEDHYFLASLYEKWNHFSEAEQHYRRIITMDSSYVGGYYKLWMMLENIGRYKDAEEVLRSYMSWDRDIVNRELNNFYTRMIKRFPEDADLNYKAGVFLYHFAEGVPNRFFFDIKEIAPDTDEERFINFMMPGLQSSAGVFKRFILPGTGDTIIIANKIVRPYTQGIIYLKKADSLLQDDDALADVNYKIGDMYTWQGLPERSVPYYKRSVDLKPEDANTREKLIESYSIIYYLKDALDQLDSLHQRKEINFPMQLLMAKYCLHSGRFTEAANLLKEAKQIHPFNVAEITDLNGRLQLLSNHPKEALKYYMEYLSANPGDSLTMYTIAKLYAKMKNKSDAWKWLKLSIDKGFNYYWVLKYDSNWKDYRSRQQWKDITAKIHAPETIE